MLQATRLGPMMRINTAEEDRNNRRSRLMNSRSTHGWHQGLYSNMWQQIWETTMQKHSQDNEQASMSSMTLDKTNVHVIRPEYYIERVGHMRAAIQLV